MSDQTSPTPPDTHERDAKSFATPESGNSKQPHTSIDREAETHVASENWKLPTAPAADEQIAHYRIIKQLGQGGMGIVYHAEDIHLQRPVALKVMRPQFAEDEARHRFVREARAMAAVKHPHIVTIFHVGEDRGAPFLAMEFLEGESLYQRIERVGRLPVAEVCRIGREIALGLAAAHDKGLIHRDIKPANIWLEGKQGHVKILDFGLARTHGDQTHLTQSGAILGTPAYMAPEQAAGERVDHRCDLFSLGCVLYQLSSGEMAFKGSNTMSILSALAVTEPAPLKSVNPELPGALSDLVMKLLTKKPEGRPATAQRVVDALNAIEENRTDVMAKAKPPPRPPAAKPAAAVMAPAAKVVPSAKPPPPKKKTEVVPPTPQSSAKKKPRPFRSKQRGPISRRVAVLLLLLAVGMAGLALWASGLVRFSTDQGDLVLETDDPDFAFSVVKGGGILLEDRKTKRVYHVNAVPHGKEEYELEVIDAGAELSFKTKTFTLKRGDKVALRAWFERKPAASVKQSGNDAGGNQVAAMPPEKQVQAVAAKLKECNPGFDGQVKHVINDGAVVELAFTTDFVTDISPVRALATLTTLRCGGSSVGKGRLADLSPVKGLKITHLEVFNNPIADLSALRGMPLTGLMCHGTYVTDLSPLREMPLQNLNIGFSRVTNLSALKNLQLTKLFLTDLPVSDLTPLQGMPLTVLDCSRTKVSDLSPLKDMPLTWLKCENLAVMSLSPLKGMKLVLLYCQGITATDFAVIRDMPLHELACDFQPDRHAELLRSIKTLTTINGKPAAEFWKEVGPTR